MRRLIMTALTILLASCAVYQPSVISRQQLETSEALDELSFRASLQWYVIENQIDIERALASLHLSLPTIVTEATAEDRKAIDCLAKNIYWEASNEPLRGKKAVAQVTVNRASDDRFPKDICGVVYERDKVKVRGRVKTICQFSWTCMKVKNKTPRHPSEWEEAQSIAKKFVLDAHVLPELEQALFYHADYVRPRWAKKMIKIEKIGAHIFYREKVKPAEKVIYLASNT